jgi:hypothetical protein
VAVHLQDGTWLYVERGIMVQDKPSIRGNALRLRRVVL